MTQQASVSTSDVVAIVSAAIALGALILSILSHRLAVRTQKTNEEWRAADELKKQVLFNVTNAKTHQLSRVESSDESRKDHGILSKLHMAMRLIKAPLRTSISANITIVNLSPVEKRVKGIETTIEYVIISVPPGILYSLETSLLTLATRLFVRAISASGKSRKWRERIYITVYKAHNLIYRLNRNLTKPKKAFKVFINSDGKMRTTFYSNLKKYNDRGLSHRTYVPSEEPFVVVTAESGERVTNRSTLTLPVGPQKYFWKFFFQGSNEFYEDLMRFDEDVSPALIYVAILFDDEKRSSLCRIPLVSSILESMKSTVLAKISEELSINEADIKLY